MDSDENALNFAGALGNAQVARGALPDGIPFDGENFDLILMSDVLEHLDDDIAALRALRSRLKASGWLVATVPAMQWLWSGHDEAHHHRRRYHASSLRATVLKAGYEIAYLGYFNFILFPVVAAMRLTDRWRKRDRTPSVSSYTTMPPSPINAMLRHIFTSERRMLGLVRMPFGVSLLLLARPAAASAQKLVA
jgi:SAM-dependent methyltransferase